MEAGRQAGKHARKKERNAGNTNKMSILAGQRAVHCRRSGQWDIQSAVNLQVAEVDDIEGLYMPATSQTHAANSSRSFYCDVQCTYQQTVNPKDAEQFQKTLQIV